MSVAWFEDGCRMGRIDDEILGFVGNVIVPRLPITCPAAAVRPITTNGQGSPVTTAQRLPLFGRVAFGDAGAVLVRCVLPFGRHECCFRTTAVSFVT